MKSKTIQTPLPYDFGKMPPQAIDFECAVLGAVMLETDAIYNVSSFLKPYMFYKMDNMNIYQAILDLQLQALPVDILTVTEQLRKTDKLDESGGLFYVTTLTGKISSAANIETYARIIEQKYIQRELIRITSEYNALAYDDNIDIKDTIDSLTLALMNVTGGIINEVQHVSILVESSIDYIHNMVAGKINPYGILTRLNSFDRVTGGLQKGLNIIAARPGMGKTAFILQLINNISIDQSVPTALFELEMHQNQLIRWLYSQRTLIYNNDIKKGRLSKDQLNNIEKEAYKIKNSPLYIDDTPGINIIQLRSKAIRLKHSYNIQLIIIDYLQLMNGVEKKQNRETEVSEISRGLQQLSRELDIPIIALSQLNRQSVNRTDKRPNLSDLRESGAIEQDADMVLFIHRPEYYGQLEDNEGNSLAGITELILAKHRDGTNDIVKILFKNDSVTFSDIPSDDINKYFEPSNNDDYSS